MSKVTFASAPNVYSSDSFCWSDTVEVSNLLVQEPKSILKQTTDSNTRSDLTQIYSYIFYAFVTFLIFGIFKAFENSINTEKSTVKILKTMISSMDASDKTIL